jgi:hypothetical protein
MNTTTSTSSDKSLNVIKCEYITLYEQKILMLNENIKFYAPKSVELLWETYQKVSTLYEIPLSPTIIYKVIDKITKKIKALKELKKVKLKGGYLHEFARNELLIHYSMSKLSNIIVNVSEYYEDKDGYYIVMEYSKYHSYFEVLLEKVITS